MWGLLKTDAKLGRPTESQTATTTYYSPRLDEGEKF